MKNKYWLLASIFFFAVALFLPALYGGGSSLAGWVVLLLGAFKIPGAESLAWLANHLFFIVVFLFLGSTSSEQLSHSRSALRQSGWILFASQDFPWMQADSTFR